MYTRPELEDGPSLPICCSTSRPCATSAHPRVLPTPVSGNPVRCVFPPFVTSAHPPPRTLCVAVHPSPVPRQHRPLSVGLYLSPAPRPRRPLSVGLHPRRIGQEEFSGIPSHMERVMVYVTYLGRGSLSRCSRALSCCRCNERGALSPIVMPCHAARKLTWIPATLRTNCHAYSRSVTPYVCWTWIPPAQRTT